MTLGISCPHCERRTVTSVRTVWFLHGFLLFCRYGKKNLVGCAQCVRKRVWLNFVTCLIGGWWCFPWGAGNPLVLLQNLWSALIPRSKAREAQSLRAVLEEAGVTVDEIEVGPDGFTNEERRVAETLRVVLRDAMEADGQVDETELARAARILRAIANDRISEAFARRLIQEAPASVEFSLLDQDQRVMVLQAAILVVAADRHFRATERGFLYELGAKLALSRDFVDQTIQQILFGGATGEESEAHADSADSEVSLARQVLGVAAGATLVEIKKRYRELMLIHHPDVAHNNGSDPSHAEKMSRQINWAYSVLRSATLPEAA